MRFSVLDTVVLNKDLPNYGLKAGDVGTIVEIYEPDGIEVEFVTGSGETQALLTLNVKDVHTISGREILSVRPLDAA